MEDFGLRDETNPLKFRNKKALLMADVSIYCTQKKPGELQTFRTPMLNTINANKSLRHAHMLGINELLMITGMVSKYEKIAKLSKTLFNIIKDTKEIKATSPAGTGFITIFT